MPGDICSRGQLVTSLYGFFSSLFNHFNYSLSWFIVGSPIVDFIGTTRSEVKGRLDKRSRRPSSQPHDSSQDQVGHSISTTNRLYTDLFDQLAGKLQSLQQIVLTVSDIDEF